MNNFNVTYETKNLKAYGQPIDYSAALIVTPRDQATQEAEVKVNVPLRAGGTDIFLLGNGYAPTITVKDPSGNIVFTDSIPFLPQDANLTSVGVVKVPDGLTEQLGMVGFFYPTQAATKSGAYFSSYPDLEYPLLTLNVFTGDLGLDAGVPASVYALNTDKMTQITGGKTGVKSLELKPGDPRAQRTGRGHLQRRQPGRDDRRLFRLRAAVRVVRHQQRPNAGLGAVVRRPRRIRAADLLVLPTPPRVGQSHPAGRRITAPRIRRPRPWRRSWPRIRRHGTRRPARHDTLAHHYRHSNRHRGNTVNLNELSIISLYSAMAVYALAFIAFAIDLARRSSVAVQAADVAVNGVATDAATGAARSVATASGATTTLTRLNARMTNDATTPYGRSMSLRVGVSLTVLAWVLHLAADLMWGIAASRVPWANMYEFAMTGTLIIVTVFLIVIMRADLRFLGTFVVGLVLVPLGIAALRIYVEVAPLPPALQSVWLVIHVFVASLGTGFFALGFALSAVQLLQFRREAFLPEGKSVRLRFLATLPSAATLENLAYRINIIGFILWTFTLMASSIWAEKAWGRYWGWDTKEVWTFIVWVVYAGYIHARATRGWRGSRSAWLAIIGFVAVMFNFGIVNVFFKGLNSYSGL